MNVPNRSTLKILKCVRRTQKKNLHVVCQRVMKQKMRDVYIILNFLIWIYITYLKAAINSWCAYMTVHSNKFFFSFRHFIEFKSKFNSSLTQKAIELYELIIINQHSKWKSQFFFIPHNLPFSYYSPLMYIYPIHIYFKTCQGIKKNINLI